MDEREHRKDDGGRKHAAPDRGEKDTKDDRSDGRQEEKQAPPLTAHEREQRWPVG